VALDKSRRGQSPLSADAVFTNHARSVYQRDWPAGNRPDGVAITIVTDSAAGRGNGVRKNVIRLLGHVGVDPACHR